MKLLSAVSGLMNSRSGLTDKSICLKSNIKNTEMELAYQSPFFVLVIYLVKYHPFTTRN
jgi:hypothetical protein